MILSDPGATLFHMPKQAEIDRQNAILRALVDSGQATLCRPFGAEVPGQCDEPEVVGQEMAGEESQAVPDAWAD